MHSEFEEINLLIYHSARGLFYDGVIWCLGPLADETREYGILRWYLAAGTRKICRVLINHR